MKKKLLIVLFCFISITSFTQDILKEVLIVACQTGELIIDGSSKGIVEAEDAHKEVLPEGEHYIQIKSGKEKINSIIKVANKPTNIFKIGCNDGGLIRLIDKQLSLYGSINPQTEKNFLAIDEGDEIIISSSVLNKKGTANLSLKDYHTGAEIYRKENFTDIGKDVVRVPKRSIYILEVSTDALFGKNAKLTVDRKPSPNSNPGFKSTVHYVYDTTTTEVLTTKIRVYSSGNLEHSNKTLIKINLPPNASYWTYWIGVGEEPQSTMKSLASEITDGLSLISTNPVALFGLKLLPNLPMLNTPSTVSYKFIDSKNTQAFEMGKPFSYYTFKYASNISTDYSLVNSNLNDLVLALSNESKVIGQNVEVRVVAFTVNSRMVMD